MNEVLLAKKLGIERLSDRDVDIMLRQARQRSRSCKVKG